MNEYSTVNTRLFHDYVVIKHPDDVCKCNDEWGEYGMCICDIPDNPRVTITLVIVDIHGHPPRFSPRDSTYRTRIFLKKCLSSEVDIYAMDDFLVADFSIASTIDVVDLETMYNKIIKKYDYILNDKHPLKSSLDYSLSKSVKSKYSPESFVLEYRKILSNILKPQSVRPQSENPHIGRRKKKK